jgi:hypothetical protein
MLPRPGLSIIVISIPEVGMVGQALEQEDFLVGQECQGTGYSAVGLAAHPAERAPKLGGHL